MNLKEVLKSLPNGQWQLEKRCWEGYEPTPGKEAYEKGSCRPVKKEEEEEETEKCEVAPKNSKNKKTYEEAFEKSDLEVAFYDNGDAELQVGEDVPQDLEKAMCDLLEAKGFEELSKKEWHPKKEHKSEKGGLTEAGRKSYNKATGGNLKPPQPQGGPRKRSFCARNKGQIKMHGIDCKKDPDKRACKARRRWKCTN